MMMASRLTLADGSQVELGALLAKAGEGSVFEVVGQPDSVIKVFHPALSDLASKFDKVAAMAATVPRGAVQSDGFPVLTWPQQLVFDGGKPAGYLMARADNATAVEIHTLSNPSNRANPLPGSPQWTTSASWAHLVNTAANLCLAVQVVHRVDAVIGDFQERNILVSDTTRVTLVDCDSMQFTDRNGRQFLCGVARPEFTAPEVASLNLRSQAREQPSDHFALAVHIYLLLMAGNHPFMRGVWSGPGEQPGALELAASGDWAGGPNSRLQTHPLAPPPSFLPADIQAMFERAFTEGATDPTQRPTAVQWRKALLEIMFMTCTGPSAHQIPVGCSECPWCAIDEERRNRRRDADDDIPDQVIYKAPGNVRKPGKPTNSAPKPTSAASSTGDDAATSAARIAHAQRLAGGLSGASSLPAARVRPDATPTPHRVSWRRRSKVIYCGLAATVAVASAVAVMVMRHEKALLGPLEDPSGVAVDVRGTVYVADREHNRVVALAAGNATPTVLPFHGLSRPEGLAVDNTGAVYVADYGNSRVLKLGPETHDQVDVGFTELQAPTGVAVDRQGAVYVADRVRHEVLRLTAGAHQQDVMWFNGLASPWGVAVDDRNSVYVTDAHDDRVLVLGSEASSEQSVLRFEGLHEPTAVAVGSDGTVYVADRGNDRVVALAAGTDQQRSVDFTLIRKPGGVAVGGDGVVYATDDVENRVTSVSGGGPQNVLAFGNG